MVRTNSSHNRKWYARIATSDTRTSLCFYACCDEALIHQANATHALHKLDGEDRPLFLGVAMSGACIVPADSFTLLDQRRFALKVEKKERKKRRKKAKRWCVGSTGCSPRGRDNNNNNNNKKSERCPEIYRFADLTLFHFAVYTSCDRRDKTKQKSQANKTSKQTSKRNGDSRREGRGWGEWGGGGG